MNIKKEIFKIAKSLNASIPEKEFEKLIGKVIKGTVWSGKVFAVGGYVRDEIMGIQSKDLDLVVELSSEKGKKMPEGSKKFCFWVFSLFQDKMYKPLQTGSSYPIWRIIVKDDIEYLGEIYKTKDAQIEVADSMKEAFPDPNSRQREVEWGTLKDDVNRRDFTVNSLLKDLSNGEIIDLTGMGRQDIEKGILRSGKDVDINELFSQDALRLLRLIRFAVKYGWTVPLSVLKAVKATSSRIEIISEERIRDELVKIMKLGKLAQAIKFFDATGLLKYIFPEIQALKGIKQNETYHQEGDCFRHSLMVLKNAPATIEGQLAALLHDAGKASTTEMIDGAIHSYGHEKVSGEIAEAVLRRLKFDLPTIRNVRKVVENHMRPHALHDAGVSGIRRFIREIGDELVDAVLDLASADERGKIPKLDTIPSLKDKITEVRRYKPQEKVKAVLNGNEIMETLNIKPSGKVKEVTDYLLNLEDKYIEDGKELTKEIAKEEIIKKFK